MKTFRTFYLQLPNTRRKEFKKDVMKRTGWSNSTFYYKSTHNNITRLEREVVLSAIGRFTRQDRATARLLEQYYGQASFAS